MAERRKKNAPARGSSKKKAAAAKKSAPAIRGRKGHGVIDQQEGFAELLDSWMLERPRPTYDEMTERLKGTGFYASRSTLAKHGMEFERQRSVLRLQIEKAKLLRSSDPDDVLALEDAIAHLLNAKFLGSLLNPDEEKVTKDDLNLSYAFGKLQTSSAQRVRTRLAVTRGIETAVRIIRAELKELLRDDTKLMNAVLAKVEQAREKLLAGGGTR